MNKKPQNSDEVYSEMKRYSEKKKFNFSDYKLRFMAEDCFLFFEARQWSGVKYWPAVAMRWVLTNTDKQTPKKQQSKKDSNIKTLRDKILEQENEF